MAVMTEVGFHLHTPPPRTRHRSLLLHTRNPLCDYRYHPISLSKHRFLFLLSPCPLHIRRSRRWDSKAESYDTKGFNFEDEIEDPDDTVEQWVEAFDDYIDSIWIFKVLGSFGWTLPPILLSVLLANGLKAFLLALALPLGQSTVAFAIQRFQNRGKIKPRRKNKAKKGRSRSYSSRGVGFEKAPEFIHSQRASKEKKGYQSWVSKEDFTASSNDKSASNFNGWDELDLGMDSSVGTSRRAAQKLGGMRGRPARKGKMGRLSDSDGPLLLRLLISVFPFLSSWTKVL